MSNRGDALIGSDLAPETTESVRTDYEKDPMATAKPDYAPGMPDSRGTDYGATLTPADTGTMAGGKTQYTEGEGRQPEHSHEARTHTHDHYHVSHHHGGGLTEWQHRTSWH